MRRRAAVFVTIVAVLLSGASGVGAANWQDARGPQRTVLLAKAGPAGEFYIRRPETLTAGSHPVAVLQVGSFSDPGRYDWLLDEVASHGVVAIAHASADPSDGIKASEALDWLLGQNEVSGSEYFGKLLPARVLGIGHSSGGSGAVQASIRNPRITSLLLYAPALAVDATTELRVPTFFVAGALDGAVPADQVRARYLRATQAPAWFGVAENQGHTRFQANDAVRSITRAWVYTQLFDDQGSARDCFYGPGWTLNGAPGWKETLRNDVAR